MWYKVTITAVGDESTCVVPKLLNSPWQLEEEVFWNQEGHSTTGGQTKNFTTGAGDILQQTAAPAAGQR